MLTTVGNLTADQLRERLSTGPADFAALARDVRALAVQDLPRALALSHELVEGSAAGSGDRLTALLARAHARGYANQFEPALTDLDDAASIADSLRLDAELGNVLLVMIQPLARLGRLDEAEAAARRAIAKLDESAHRLQAGKARVNLGVVLRMRGKAAAALEAFDAAIPILSEDRMACAMIQSNRAEALLNLDRFEESRVAFEEALAVFAAQGAGHAAAMVEGNLADLLSRLGRVDDAVLRFEAAQARYQTAGALGDVARLQAEEAEALLGVGAARRAAALYERAASHLEPAGMAREAARARLGLGLARLRTGALIRARQDLDRALELAARVGDTPLEGECLIVLSELERLQNRPAAARDRARAALDRLADRPQRRAVALMTLAEVELAQNDPKAASASLDLAQAALQEDPVAPVRVRLLHLRARADIARGRIDSARRALSDAADAAESFRGTIRGEHARTAFFETAQSLYHDLVRATFESSGRDDAAAALFDAAERLMGRSVREALGAGSPAVQGAGPSPHELTAEYAAIGPSPGVQGGGDRLHRLRELEEAREHAQIRAEARGRRPADIAPINLDTLKASLAPGHAFAVVLNDGPAVSALMVTASGATIRRKLITRADLAILTRRFEFALAESITAAGAQAEDRLRHALAQLGHAVLDPVIAMAPDASSLTWALSAELQRLPLLAAMVVHRRPGPVTSLAPSATVAHALRTLHAQPEGGPRRLIVGVGDRAAPRAEDEARQVAGVYPGATCLSGASARAADVLEAARDSTLIHIACHAVFDSEFPMSSRLLAADRWITARELLGAVRPGAIVVLAGCGTARAGGHAPESENPRGLVQALLASGAGAVVASLWPLQDEGACPLMHRLHSDLSQFEHPRAGQVAAALARTMITMHDDGYPAHLWGALSVTGAL